MSTRKLIAVMHCKPKEPTEVQKLAISVVGGLYNPANATIFTTIPVTLAVFQAAIDALTASIANAKGNHDIKTLRDKQSLALYNMMHDKLIPYINSVAAGDKVIIEKSGFDASSDPQPHGVPDAPVIKKITDGKIPQSAKIILEKVKKVGGIVTGKQAKRKKTVKYSAQVTATPDKTDSWVTALHDVASTKLLVPNRPRNTDLSYRVIATNAYGDSVPSNVVVFSAR